MNSIIEVVFRAAPADHPGHYTVGAVVTGNTPCRVGHLKPLGEALSVHGSAEGAPQIAICADVAHGVMTLVNAFSQQALDTLP